MFKSFESIGGEPGGFAEGEMELREVGGVVRLGNFAEGQVRLSEELVAEEIWVFYYEVDEAVCVVALLWGQLPVSEKKRKLEIEPFHSTSIYLG